MYPQKHDLIIVGSGSAAFAAAIRARSHGASAALVERDIIGGTCVNVGCIPSKFALEAAQRQHDCPRSALDLEIRTALAAALQNEGIEITTDARITNVQREGVERVVHLAPKDGRHAEQRFDAILVATGRRPNTARLNLDVAGIRTAGDGAVITDAYLRTDNPRVYAAGDVTGAPQFVYVAAYQGALAAENALNGSPKRQNLLAVPRVIFSQPRLAAVGETEAEARARGQEVETAVLNLGDNVPRAIVNGQGGAIKIIATASERKIIGVHMVGEHSDEVIQAATYIVKFGLTAEQIVDTFHPYLTMAESLRLCAQTFDRDPATLSCCAS